MTRISAKDLVKRIFSKTQVIISQRSVFAIQQRVRQEYDAPLPILTDSLKRARLQFAREMLDSGLRGCGDIVFSDGAHIVFHGFSLDVWAAIGRGYKSPLMFHVAPLDCARYRALVDLSKLIPDCNALYKRWWSFQFDNERSHVGRASLSWLGESGVRWLPGWLTKARDFNVIEYVWPLLQRAADECGATTEEAAKAALRECWASLSQSECVDPLVASFRSRLEAVERSGGGAIPRRPSESLAAEPPALFTAAQDRRLLEQHASQGNSWGQLGSEAGVCAASARARVEQLEGLSPWLLAGRAVICGVTLRRDGPSTVEARRDGGPLMVALYDDAMRHPLLNGLIVEFLSQQGLGLSS
jgi:hypothetical protein